MEDGDSSDVAGDPLRGELSDADVAGDGGVDAGHPRVRGRRRIQERGPDIMFMIVAANDGWPAHLPAYDLVPGAPAPLVAEEADEPWRHVVGVVTGAWHLRDTTQAAASDHLIWPSRVSLRALRTGVRYFGFITYEGVGFELLEKVPVREGANLLEVYELVKADSMISEQVVTPRPVIFLLF